MFKGLTNSQITLRCYHNQVPNYNETIHKIEAWKQDNSIQKTRMHYSGMRTTRLLSVSHHTLGGGCLPGGVYPGWGCLLAKGVYSGCGCLLGVVYRGGCLPGGVCWGYLASEGVCLWVSAGGGVRPGGSPGPETDTPMDRQTPV